jgi:hypothetical protein
VRSVAGRIDGRGVAAERKFFREFALSVVINTDIQRKNRRLNPWVEVAILSQEWKEALRDNLARERHDQVHRKSSNTLISSLAFVVEPSL